MNGIKKLSNFDPRLIKWDKRLLLDRNCPLCFNRGQKRYRRPDNLLVNYCETCGTYYISPAPTEEALKKFYENNFQDYFGALSIEEAEVIKQEPPLSSFIIKEISSLVNLPEAKVLEIGCGLGKYLYLLKTLGTKVYGIDLNKDAVRFAINNLGLHVEQADWKKFLLEDNKFNILLLLDLLEHPLDIHDLLIKSINLLSKDGLLVIRTPNASNAHLELEPICFRRDLTHMQYFTMKSINYIATKFNLLVVHLESFGFTNKPESQTVKRKIFIKRILRKLPGVVILWRKLLREIKERKSDDIRLGNYEILVIFHKTSDNSINL